MEANHITFNHHRGTGHRICLILSKLFGRGREDNVVEGEEASYQDHRRNKPSALPMFLSGLLVAGLVLFVLPRFGIILMGLLQKAIAFLPLIRGFLPF